MFGGHGISRINAEQQMMFPVYPGLFIWHLAILSMLMLTGAILIALWDRQRRRSAVRQIFAWLAGFLLIGQVGLHILLRWYS